MSLSEAPSVKITYSTPQDISDEVLGGAIHFCRIMGYTQNVTMLTFFWSSFLFSSKKMLDENGITNDILKCYTYSLAKVFPQILRDAELRERINNAREQYWNRLSADFNLLQSEAEIVSFIKIADELNKRNDTFAGELKKDPQKTFSQYVSNICSSIYDILHDIDNGMCIQYKYVLDDFRLARVQQSETISTPQHQKSFVNTQPASDTVNERPLGMAWHKFLIYFLLIASAIINSIYSFGYISGNIYLVETNGVVSAEQVYAYYGIGLQAVDMVYGLFLIAFAILAFVVRHKLANYKSDSLKFIKIFYSLSVGIPFLYSIFVAAITRQALAVQSVIYAIVGLVFLILNIKYFKKRAHLFVDQTVSTQPSIQYRSQFQTQSERKNIEIPIVTQPTKSSTSTKRPGCHDSKIDVDVGLIPNKPIRTKNITEQKHVLETLHSLNGDRITWVRRGGFYVESINGIVEVFDGYLPSGVEYKTIYLCVDGIGTNTVIIPKGFSYVNV